MAVYGMTCMCASDMWSGKRDGVLSQGGWLYSVVCAGQGARGSGLALLKENGALLCSALLLSALLLIRLLLFHLAGVLVLLPLWLHVGGVFSARARSTGRGRGFFGNLLP